MTNIKKPIKKPLIAIIVIAVAFTVVAQAASPPYPPSPVITGITWDTSSTVTAAPGSDLWPTTWAGDGRVYTSWGDGGGFGGSNSSGRVSMGFARLAGAPPGFTPTNVNGGVNSENPATWGCSACGKTAGILAVDGVLYAWVNEQNSTPPNLRLYWSNDFAATWQSANWKFPDSADPQFLPSSFVNFGKDYAGARDNYVYIYGARWIFADGPENSVYLARVLKTEITNRAAYEFFAGVNGNGNPIWVADIAQRQPVFTDPNGVNNTGLTNVVYNAPLKRYILTSSHRGSSSPGTDLARLGIFDAPEPWGPWTTVAYYDTWLGLSGGALNYDIAAKWISADGKTFWMTYSGAGADRFNLVKGTFTLAGPLPNPPTNLQVQ